MRDQDSFLERALLEDQRITREQMEAARRHGADHGLDLTDALIATEALSSHDLAIVKADLCESPFVKLTDFDPSLANSQLLPRAVAERFCLFPLFVVDGVLTLAMDDPLNLEAMDQVRQITRCELDAVLCDRVKIGALIARAYSLSHIDAGVVKARREGEPGVKAGAVAGGEAIGPVVSAVNQLLGDAIDHGASDVHINPDEGQLHLRYRVDGVLREQQGPPLSMHTGIVQRLKVMANLDLTQTRRAQDGKFRFVHHGRTIEVRMSSVPTVCGENIVMRLLTSTKAVGDFTELGLPAPMAAAMDELVSRPYGMVLVTGPTGSGKTTTLYTALSRINQPTRNIMTIEDPVEIRLPYVRQIQVHGEIGWTFATALRSILRQDPDVVLVGEIRDEETATIALQAALTGHLVLTTLHTNDAAGAIARLRNFGLPSFVINSAVLGVVAQRLVRRVCKHCAEPETIEERVRRRFSLEAGVHGFIAGRGCGRCGQMGYRGRVGLFELMPFTSAVQAAVEQGSSTERIREAAVLGGMRLLWQDGLEKARLGLTTLSEVAKVAFVIEISGEEDNRRRAA